MIRIVPRSRPFFRKAPIETTPSLSTEQILREEAAAIHNEDLCERKGGALYRELNKLNSAALCLSGGGIRSAAFALGAIQSLAAHPRTAKGDPVEAPHDSLLAQFHYLSTVSGGGYTGSWLSAWCSRHGFPTIWRNLTKRPDGFDVEPTAIAWLRSYSNYLTPKLGILSADSWAVLSIYLRNLFLNWLVILPVIAALILLIKFVAIFLVGITVMQHAWRPPVAIGIVGVLAMIVAGGVTTSNRPSRQTRLVPTEGRQSFLPRYLVFSLLAAICFTQFLGSDIVGLQFEALKPGCSEIYPQSAFGLKFEYVGARCEYFIDKVSVKPADRVASGDRIERIIDKVDKVVDKVDKVVSKAGDTSNVVAPDKVAISYYKTKHSMRQLMAGGVVLGTLIYALGWLWAWPRRRELRDFYLRSFSGAIYGAVVAVGFHYYLEVPAKVEDAQNSLITELVNSPMMYLMLGVPWMLFAQWLADMVFVGLTSYQEEFNADQEWLGRAGGWLLVCILGWFSAVFIIFAEFLTRLGPTSTQFYLLLQYWVVPIVALTGFATAVIGSKNLSGFYLEAKGPLALTLNVVLAIAVPLFIGALLFGLSIGLDHLVLHHTLFQSPFWDAIDHGLKTEVPTNYKPWITVLRPLAEWFWVFVVVSVIASLRVNINRFSLHALYRNRLIRAFLGAGRTRNPNSFSGFDPDDDLPMHRLWPKQQDANSWPPRQKKNWRPFQVVNMTLNIVSSKRLSWQERKAASFTASPLHCGTASKAEVLIGDTEQQFERLIGAYRPSTQYSGPHGMSLGTAMAISGAAASPNMGYHSSPAVTLLMTMLNARLGWWLGNPAKEGDKTYRHEGPTLAIVPLLEETFGLTTDSKSYIHLSDGGHFENLGLYEMVRRRCRLILICDAGRDPTFAFGDLGNAVRKIAIDFGIGIRFHRLSELKRRSLDGSDLGPAHDYHTVAEIDYQSTDGPEVSNGIVVYIKAGYHGAESAGVKSYAMANADFPHQSTANQWFGESQFEAYRSLGFEIMEKIFSCAAEYEPYASTPSLDNLATALLKRGDCLDRDANRDRCPAMSGAPDPAADV